MTFLRHGPEECIQRAWLQALLEETTFAWRPLCSPGHLIQVLNGKTGARGTERRREGRRRKEALIRGPEEMNISKFPTSLI